MASLNDLFGGGQEKRPKSPVWREPGDSHAYQLVGEPENVQQVEVNGSWEPQYLEKQDDGKWKVRIQSELTEGSERGPLMQIVLPVRMLPSGDLATIYIDNKTKKAALKEAMEESGIDLVSGTGVKQTREKNVGKMWGWSFKLALPKEKKA